MARAQTAVEREVYKVLRQRAQADAVYFRVPAAGVAHPDVAFARTGFVDEYRAYYARHYRRAVRAQLGALAVVWMDEAAVSRWRM